MIISSNYNSLGNKNWCGQASKTTQSNLCLLRRMRMISFGKYNLYSLRMTSNLSRVLILCLTTIPSLSKPERSSQSTKIMQNRISLDQYARRSVLLITSWFTWTHLSSVAQMKQTWLVNHSSATSAEWSSNPLQATTDAMTIAATTTFASIVQLSQILHTIDSATVSADLKQSRFFCPSILLEI